MSNHLYKTQISEKRKKYTKPRIVNSVVVMICIDSSFSCSAYRSTVDYRCWTIAVPNCCLLINIILIRSVICIFERESDVYLKYAWYPNVLGKWLNVNMCFNCVK